MWLHSSLFPVLKSRKLERPKVVGHPPTPPAPSFLVAQLVKNPPAMWETWVQSLGWEDPLENTGEDPTPVFWPGEFHGL